MSLKEVMDKLGKVDGFMLAVSYRNGESLDHVLLTNNFEILDMLPAHDEVKNLIFSELEKEHEAMRKKIGHKNGDGES